MFRSIESWNIPVEQRAMIVNLDACVKSFVSLIVCHYVLRLEWKFVKHNSKLCKHDNEVAVMQWFLWKETKNSYQMRSIYLQVSPLIFLCLPRVMSPIRSMTTCIGNWFCDGIGDNSDALFVGVVSVSKRICSKNSNKLSRSKWRTTNSNNLD